LPTQNETLIETEDVRVRVMNLPPGESTPLHHHTEVTDHMVGLEGLLKVKLKEPEEEIELKPGKLWIIPPDRTHQIVNSSSTKSAKYLLIQGVGRYDFLTE